MPEYIKEVVDTEQVLGRKAGGGKPRLADLFAAWIDEDGVIADIDNGERSGWYVVQEGMSETMIRSAAKFLGLSTRMATTIGGDPVFCFSGYFKERGPRAANVDEAKASKKAS